MNKNIKDETQILKDFLVLIDNDEFTIEEYSFNGYSSIDITSAGGDDLNLSDEFYNNLTINDRIFIYEYLIKILIINDYIKTTKDDYEEKNSWYINLNENEILSDVGIKHINSSIDVFYDDLNNVNIENYNLDNTKDKLTKEFNALIYTKKKNKFNKLLLFPLLPLIIVILIFKRK